jgi:hypothetical protein
VRRHGGNPDAVPHEFTERGRRHGNIPLRSDPAKGKRLKAEGLNPKTEIRTVDGTDDKRVLFAARTSNSSGVSPPSFHEKAVKLLFRGTSIYLVGG